MSLRTLQISTFLFALPLGDNTRRGILINTVRSRIMKYATLLAFLLIGSLAAKEEDATPVLRDYACGITFQDRIGELSLEGVSYASPRIRFFLYANARLPDYTVSLDFRIETNKFNQLQNLEEESWGDIKKHANELYRINAPFEINDNDYTYAYTSNEVIKRNWARFGEVLVLTGWQNFPTIENKYPQGKKYNLHVLAIKGDQCFFVTYTKSDEIKADDKVVSVILEILGSATK